MPFQTPCVWWDLRLSCKFPHHKTFMSCFLTPDPFICTQGCESGNTPRNVVLLLSFFAPLFFPPPCILFLSPCSESLALRQDLEDRGDMGRFPLREKAGGRKRGSKMLGKMLRFSHNFGMWLWALFSGYLSCALWMHPPWWYLKAVKSMVLPLRQMCSAMLPGQLVLSIAVGCSAMVSCG